MTNERAKSLQSQKDIDHLDELLDEALKETFPASDPIAVGIDRQQRRILG